MYAVTDLYTLLREVILGPLSFVTTCGRFFGGFLTRPFGIQLTTEVFNSLRTVGQFVLKPFDFRVNFGPNFLSSLVRIQCLSECVRGVINSVIVGRELVWVDLSDQP